MRIHQLEVTAFGPFAGCESVDFDTLTDAGLFLLWGPTGAGKTSVLDAICFGLYGEVPGDRNAAKRLRSDHATPGAAPSVLLEVSIHGRRFRIRRSPAWTRPKRRGTGTTTEQARVTLEESVDGAWVHLSSRLDETGQMVTDLLGMNVGQFTQVALLPQGRFQSFLRARSDERHKLLQQLFRTARFEDIERWLVAHRQSLRAASKGHQDAVASVVSRLSEAADADLPTEWDLHDLAAPAESGEVHRWAAGLLATTASTQETITGEVVASTRRAAEARRRVTQARAVLDLQARHATALEGRRSIEESREHAEATRARLDAARRAAAVTSLARVASAEAERARSAQRHLVHVLSEAADALGADVDGLSHDDLAAAEQDAKDTAAVARTLLPRERELKEAQQIIESATAELSGLEKTAAALDTRCRHLPLEIADVRQRLEEQISLAAGLEVAEVAEQQVCSRLEAAARLVELRAEGGQAHDRLQECTDLAQVLRDRMQDVREARINGMAAELAAALGGGESCPVCGSVDHPAVARFADGAPTRADEDAARTAYEDADFTRQAAAEAVITIEHNIAMAAQATGGKSSEELQRELQEIRVRRDTCVAARAEQERLGEQISTMEQALVTVREQAHQVGAEQARLAQRRDHAQEVVDKVSAELSALLEKHGATDGVARLIESRSRAGVVFASAREALQSRDAAETHALEVAHQALECALEHGFEGTEQASAAALDRGLTEKLEAQLQVREDLRARTEAVLSDPEVQEAAAVDAPDLAALESASAESEEQLTDCTARARVVESRAQRLERLGVELTAELNAWAPTRAAYSVAHTMSTFAEGKGGDNTLQMRLSAYVLAARLRQVVAAANERLGAMSDRRYTLEHSAARGVGEVRGGLSLMIRDEWTGESRDPATLSGGETFVASLALALGLADVVTQEAGGSNIDTLFIDEGFGSLDPDTLDDVMNTLDGLRDGGRVVGVVSHVPEMRNRVTSQLQIRKDRAGSHIVAARETL